MTLEPLDPAEIERRNEETLRDYDRLAEQGPPDDDRPEEEDLDEQDPGQ